MTLDGSNAVICTRDYISPPNGCGYDGFWQLHGETVFMLGYTCDGYGGREGHEGDEGRTRGGWSSRCWMNVKRECL